MKDSGIPWVGEIPAEWEVGRIGGLYKHRNQKVSDADFPPLSVTMKGVVPQLETAAKSDDHDNRKLVRIGDFAINSRSDRRGSCGVSSYDGSVSLINTVLEPREAMCPSFYNLLFHTTEFADEFYKWGHGIVDDLWTTRWQDMKAMKVPLPSIDEQQLIADYLDERCAAIDEVRRTIEDEIEALRRLRKSTIHKAVTKGLDEDVLMRDSGVEWLGYVPSHWDIHRVKNNYRVIGGNGFPIEMQGREDGDYPFLKASDIANAGKHAYEAANYVTERDVIAKAFNVIPIGSVLLPKIGESLKKNNRCIAAVECCVDNNCQGLAPSGMDEVYSYYLWCVIDAIWFDNAGTVPCISNRRLLECGIPYPSLSEQQRIADYLDERCAAIDSVIDTRTRQLQRLDDYRRALIFAYVTGKKEVPSHE